MTVYKFESVKNRASKSGKCVCGKRITRSITFEQTLNPWNKKANGEVKSYSDIWAELKNEVIDWEAKPVFHSRVMAGNWDLYNEKGVVVLSCGEQIPKENYN